MEELKEFQIYGGSGYTPENIEYVKKEYIKSLSLIKKDLSFYQSSFYDGVDNNTGYEWYDLQNDADIEEAVITLGNILDWLKRFDAVSVYGITLNGNSDMIGMRESIIQCSENCMPAVGSEAYDRLKFVCEKKKIRVFSNCKAIDLFTGQVYRIIHESYPGSADDAASYVSISMDQKDICVPLGDTELKIKWQSGLLREMLYIYRKAEKIEDMKQMLLALEGKAIEEAKTAEPEQDIEKTIISTKVLGQFVYHETSRELSVEICSAPDNNISCAMLQLVCELEKEDDMDYFQDKQVKLVFKNYREEISGFFQWERLILYLFPWITQLGYYEEKNTIQPNITVEDNEKKAIGVNKSEKDQPKRGFFQKLKILMSVKAQRRKTGRDKL